MTFENVFENTPHIQYSKSHRPYTAGHVQYFRCNYNKAVCFHFLLLAYFELINAVN